MNPLYSLYSPVDGASASNENLQIFNTVPCPFKVFFLRLTRRMCWRNAKDHMGTSGGQALTVNPSTDLLVAAQYAPVSEVAYQPAQQEDTEQSKLMPQENKELTNEDTDRMVESDPRIVLRPLNPPAHEET
ncbi:uncharacterized protein LOC111692930 [Anoplophora glabripennis]|uniref:uncharacterized protein LOC111692930 n=1 Tax=Anoplophora glabripennis TaxID=217634 RepID=UPI000C768B81|nr:uncharacterized protein LOC111692930 [Anoplophora glabripennis]